MLMMWTSHRPRPGLVALSFLRTEYRTWNAVSGSTYPTLWSEPLFGSSLFCYKTVSRHYCLGFQVKGYSFLGSESEYHRCLLRWLSLKVGLRQKGFPKIIPPVKIPGTLPYVTQGKIGEQEYVTWPVYVRPKRSTPLWERQWACSELGISHFSALEQDLPENLVKRTLKVIRKEVLRLEEAWNAGDYAYRAFAPIKTVVKN